MRPASRSDHPGVFDWRAGNRFALLVDGPQFYPRMLAAIAAATAHIELELYLLEDGECSRQLFAALAQAAQRGVQVRCLFDAFGSRGLSPAAIAPLQQAGVSLRWYNPLRSRLHLSSFYRDHRKLLIVDGHSAWVGGCGATDDFWQPGSAESAWHELMVEQQGPLVADWQLLFDYQWQDCEGSCLWQPRAMPVQGRLPARPGERAGFGRLAYADARQHRDILQALLLQIRRARQRIWLATPYFLPLHKVRRALCQAARRGVDVRLLLTGRVTDSPPIRYAGQRYYRRLLRNGVHIFEYQPRFLHLKAVLVDDWCSIGSCNFDRWTLHFDLEANVESGDPQLIAELTAVFQQDFAQSHEVSWESWLARPWWQRAYEHLWASLDRLAIHLLRR